MYLWCILCPLHTPFYTVASVTFILSTLCDTDPHDYAGLNYEPRDVDFLNEVAAEIPTLWREVGMELGLKPHQLDCIETEQNRNQVQCFGAVFRRWREQQTTPCTWATIIQALQTKAVSQHKLAQELKKKFVTPWNTIVSLYHDRNSHSIGECSTAEFNIILYHLMFCIVLYCALTVIAKLNRFQNHILTTLSEFWA